MLHFAEYITQTPITSTSVSGIFKCFFPFDGDLVGCLFINDPAQAGEIVFGVYFDAFTIGAVIDDGTTTVDRNDFTLPGTKGTTVRVDCDQLPTSGTIPAGVKIALVFDDGISVNGGSLTWRGVWNAASAYVTDDVVERNGSSYVAIASSTNITPGTDATYWSLLAQKGDTGAQGAAGAAGAQGPAGVQGAAGAQGPAGAAGTNGQGYTWRGAWASGTAYAAYDTVSFSGSSYVAIAASTGITPGTDATKWNLVAQKGDTGAAGSGGGGSRGVYTPDAAPAVPSALDDNFNTGALDAKWTEYQAAFHTLAVNNSHLRLTMTSQASDRINGLFQPIPSGDWIAITKLRHLSPFKAYISAGLMLVEDAINNPNTSDLMIFQDGRWDQPAADSHLISLARFSDYTTFSSAPFADLVIEKSQMMYQRVDKVGTNYTFYYSFDGIYWFTYGTLAASAFFTPQQIGLFIANTLTAKTAVVMFDFFRLYAAGTTEFGGEI